MRRESHGGSGYGLDSGKHVHTTVAEDNVTESAISQAERLPHKNIDLLKGSGASGTANMVVIDDSASKKDASDMVKVRSHFTNSAIERTE